MTQQAEPVAGGPRAHEFAGKVALVTGAASGQGRAVARALVAAGGSVIGFDRDRPLSYPAYLDHGADELDRLADELGEAFLPTRGDVRDQESLDLAVSAGVERFGGLDIVFANAGICAYGYSHELSEQEWQDMIGINLTGVWHTTKAATPALIARGGGVIITNSSIGGLRGMRRLSHYAAAKWGVIGLTKSIAIELAPPQYSGSEHPPHRGRHPDERRARPGGGENPGGDRRGLSREPPARTVDRDRGRRRARPIPGQ